MICLAFERVDPYPCRIRKPFGPCGRQFFQNRFLLIPHASHEPQLWLFYQLDSQISRRSGVSWNRLLSRTWRQEKDSHKGSIFMIWVSYIFIFNFLYTGGQSEGRVLCKIIWASYTCVDKALGLGGKTASRCRSGYLPHARNPLFCLAQTWLGRLSRRFDLNWKIWK